MNEDELRQLLVAEANKIVPSPRGREKAERRAAQLRRRRTTVLSGAGALTAAAAVLVAVMISINNKPASQRVPTLSPPTAPDTIPAGVTGTPGPGQTGGGAEPTSTTVKSASAADSSRCHTSQLAVSTGPVGAAAGTIAASFVLTNTSKVTCTLLGYPGFSLLDNQGQPMIGNVGRKGGPAFPVMKPARVTLAPRRAASFSVGYSDVPTGPEPCRMSVSALITPPDETTQLTIADQAPVCGQLFYVSPVVAGANGAAP